MRDALPADSIGSARFFLTKTVGNQQIRIDLDCSPVPADDEEGYEDEGSCRAGVWCSFRMDGIVPSMPPFLCLFMPTRAHTRLEPAG